MKRRMIGILLTCAMCCTLFSTPVLAAETKGSSPNGSDVASKQLDETLRAVSDYDIVNGATSIDRSYDNTPNGAVGGFCDMRSLTTGLTQELQARDTMASLPGNMIVVDYTYDLILV